MSPWLLILREIRVRWISFGLAVVSVLVAVAVLTAQLTLLLAHDLHTDQMLEEKRAETEAEMRVLEDDYRKIMKKLGFNILILPEGQRLTDLHANGSPTSDMSESYVETLANAGIMTIRHLAPIVEQEIQWPEEGGRRVILVGTRGEVPLSHREPLEPMIIPVRAGSAVLGYEIWGSLELEVGDTITLLGKEFTVSRCHSERGTRDDVTVWIDLREAQHLLHMEGRINAILALKCHCEGADVGSIRESMAAILPGVQVVELASRSATRSEARDRAAAAAEAALEAERVHRALMRGEKEAFASWLIPLVMLGAAVWTGVLALINVRERTAEIGILRALGVRSRQIMLVFLARALLVGLGGALLGYGVGFLVGVLASGFAPTTDTAGVLFKPVLLGLVAVAAPLLAALASWPPALAAARQDPAIVLREE
ncbi:MAG: ABC transporter permease [Armatimonadetes bacterium]|nr:ABC transporter permease [Armatimonadota bacterium]